MSNKKGTFDLGPDGKTILLALVAQKSASKFSASDFTLLIPAHFLRTDAKTGLSTNSVVKLIRSTTKGDKDARLIFYNRIDAQQFGKLSFSMPIGSVAADLLPLVNERFGIDIQPSEIINSQMSIDSMDTFRFEFINRSVVFKGFNLISLSMATVDDLLYFTNDYGKTEPNTITKQTPFGVAGVIRVLKPLTIYSFDFVFSYLDSSTGETAIIVYEVFQQVVSDANGEYSFALGSVFDLPLTAADDSVVAVSVNVKLFNPQLQTTTFIRQTNAIGIPIVSIGIKLYTWGADRSGAPVVFSIDENDILSPMYFSPGWKVGYKTLALSYRHVLAIKEDGSLWAWGNNRFGQLGLGFANDSVDVQATPVRVGTDNDWKMVSTGQLFSLALKEDGTFWGWGNDDDSSLAGFPGLSPRIIASGTWVDIGAGFDSSMGIKSDGTFWSTGRNRDGKFGIGNYNNQTTFVQETTRATNWAKIVHNELNASSILLLKSNGDLYFAGQPFLAGVVPWDFNDYFPFRLAAPGPWVSMVSSGNHCLGVKTDGTLWSWGINDSGQLGYGIAGASRLEATQVGTKTNWVNVSAGFDHSAALNLLGELYTFGFNGRGQLGRGTRISSSSPVLITNSILQVTTGSSDTFALTNNTLSITPPNSYTPPGNDFRLLDTFSGSGRFDEHFSDSNHQWVSDGSFRGQIELLSVGDGYLNMGSNPLASFDKVAQVKNNRVLPSSYYIELEFLVDQTKVSSEGIKDDQLDLILGVAPGRSSSQTGLYISFILQNNSTFVYMFSQGGGGFGPESYADLTINSILPSGLHTVRVEVNSVKRIIFLDNVEILRTEGIDSPFSVAGNLYLHYQDFNNGRYKPTRIEEFLPR